MTMRLLVTLVSLTVVVLAGRSAAAMNDTGIRHLLTRTGFGVAPDEYERFKAMDYRHAVDALLAETRTIAVSPAPEWIDEPGELDRQEMRALSEEARKEKNDVFRRVQRERSQELKAWWYGEMLTTDSPMTERMTLLWHNHFTSGLRKVRSPQTMYRQNATLRLHALGNVRQMTHALARDPAMIVYLDNASNRKGRPNENFARELMELFTLGEGHYTEQDIKEAARAFTGWGVNRREGTFNFIPRQHDSGIKTFRGQSGNFGGHEVIEIIFQDPRVSIYITEKLWREFISPTPDPKEVERLAAVLRDNDYEIKPLLREILLSPAFREEVNRGTLIKSPVDLMVGTLRTFDIEPENAQALARQGRQLGQDLFDPPNVKGWPGGNAWIDSNTYLLRKQVLEALTRGPDPDRREMMRNRRQNARRQPSDDARSDLTADERRMLQRAAALRREGMDPPQIAQQMQEEGFDPRQLRATREKVRQRREAVLAGPAADMSADSMTDSGEMPAPEQPARPNPPSRMPRLDLASWRASLGEKAGNETIVNLLLAAAPTEADPAERNADRLIKQLLLDPAYQLK
jgi:uncharacterized protein (DUF1800 family)